MTDAEINQLIGMMITRLTFRLDELPTNQSTVSQVESLSSELRAWIELAREMPEDEEE